MKAIGYTTSLPILDEKSLVDIELPKPVASGQDILVKISAIAVNPVDYKIRQNVVSTDGSFKAEAACCRQESISILCLEAPTNENNSILDIGVSIRSTFCNP